MLHNIYICIAIIISITILHARPSQIIEPISQEAANIFNIDMQNQGTYRIYKAIPKSIKGPLNILYMLDGNAQFPTALNIYAKHIKNGNLAIIAIGHNGDLAYDTNFRSYNYTIDTIDNPHYAKTGGAAQFYTFLSQIINDNNKQYKANKTSFFGHSFAGLFCLYVLFNHTQSFNNYICASPSLWLVKNTFIPPYIKNHDNIDSVSIIQGSMERKRDQKNMHIKYNSHIDKLLQNSHIESISIILNGKSHGEVIPYAIKFAIQKSLEY